MDLYIIAGPPESGKMELVKVILKKRSEMVLVHRGLIADALRTERPLKGGVVTSVMEAIVNSLLQSRQSVLVVSSNLAAEDRFLWDNVARRYRLRFYRWYDIREEAVRRLIDRTAVGSGLTENGEGGKIRGEGGATGAGRLRRGREAN